MLIRAQRLDRAALVDASNLFEGKIKIATLDSLPLLQAFSIECSGCIPAVSNGFSGEERCIVARRVQVENTWSFDAFGFEECSDID